MIAVGLGKHQALDADPKAIQQINFTGNLAQEGNENTAIFFIIEETNKKKHFRLTLNEEGTRNTKSMVNLFYFNIISV